MDTRSLTLKKTVPLIILLSSTLPLCTRANNIHQAGSMSGELLQNNPMLNVPLAPQSKGLNEIKDDLAGNGKEKNNTEKRGPEIKVYAINVVDAPQKINSDIRKFVENHHGKNMTLGELQGVAIEITSILQHHGERLSYAYIPNQKVINGTVTIKIMTGHIETIRLHNNLSLVNDTLVNYYINKIETINTGIIDIEKQLLYISDLPGIGSLSPFLSAGNNKGGSILSLDLSPSPRVQGVAVFDNTGSISSGRNRVGTQVNINSPFSIGDRLQALAYFSPDFMQINNESKHGNTFISRVSYDIPMGINGTRSGISFSRVNYKLGGPVLHGLGDGFAEISSLYGSHSLIRSNKTNMNLGINLDLKRMNDTFWEESNRRSSTLLSAQLFGNIPSSLWGKNNVIQYHLSSTAGRLNNSDNWNGLKTKGNFFKTNQNIKYQQGLMQGLAFNLTFNGQQASKNLDGAEKMSLGGPYAVRAYSNSSASADSAWILSPGFNFIIPGVEGMTAEVFYDYASGKIQKFSRRPSKVNLRGYGVGINYDITSTLFFNASYAWRDGQDKLMSSQNKAMGWVTTGYRF